MGRREVVAIASAIAVGAAAGFLAERRVVRRTLPEPRPGEPALGGLSGDISSIDGPNGLRLTVESYGPAGAPVIVFVHGITTGRRIWHEQVRALQGRFRLVTYDQPGHGDSGAPDRYSPEVLAESLRAVLEQAAGGARVTLVGHSLGGFTMLALAAQDPVFTKERAAGVVLICSSARPAATSSGVPLKWRLERALRPGMRAISLRAKPLIRALAGVPSDIRHGLFRLVALTPHADTRHVEFVERLWAQADPRMVEALLEAVENCDIRGGLAALPDPTVIVAGARDIIMPPYLSREMADQVPHAELCILPGVGHMAQLEAHHHVSALVERVAATAANGT